MFVVGAYNDDLYNTLLVLHILCAIVGFGAVVLNAIYGNEVKKRPGPEGIAIFDANEKVSAIGELFIVAVFFLGIALVLASDDLWKFGQTWVWLAMLLFIVAMGLSQGVMRPTLKRMRVLMGELAAGPPPGAGGGAPAGPPPQVLELGQLGKRLAVIGPTLQVLLVVILGLMVWKPGT
jgi:uncharacterized membrane protein